jgi:hypothetical protein
MLRLNARLPTAQPGFVAPKFKFCENILHAAVRRNDDPSSTRMMHCFALEGKSV